MGSLPRSSVVRTPLRSTFSDFDQGFASERTETLTVGPELSTYTRTSPGSSAPEPTGSSGRLTWTLPLAAPVVGEDGTAERDGADAGDEHEDEGDQPGPLVLEHVILGTTKPGRGAALGTDTIVGLPCT